MPYAISGQISQAPIDGGIEITDDQYQQALAGMLKGKVVSTGSGFSIVDRPAPLAPEADPPLQDANGVPVEVSKAQAYTALYNAGALEPVMTWINADPLRGIQAGALSTFRRDSQLMEAGREALGWTPEQLDALFVAAAQVVL